MVFEKYNANPFGKKTGDCVVRAICKASGKSWEDVYKGMFDVAMKTGYAISCKDNYKYYLKQLGYDMQKMPVREDRTRYTVEQFVDEIAKPRGIYVISIANHLTCVRHKVLYDLWNCHRKCVGNYWIIKRG